MAETFATTTGPPPITTRDQLVAALKDAAEMEQLFLCQYLYSALSLKKEPDAACSPAQLESVRRWASTVYMIARQEMEHLSLVASMLSAVGAPPHFDRPNIPVQLAYFRGEALRRHHHHGPDAPDTPVPCDLPFLFEPFGLRTVRWYACMESPRFDQTHDPERQAIRLWCFEDDQGRCNSILPDGRTADAHRPHVLAALPAGAPEFVIGDIERAYARIREGFVTLAAGAEPLFVGNPGRQVEILSEYNIYLFPITDLASALSAIDLITEQGEGLGGPPGFDSHFLNFYQIALEFEVILAEHPGFEPALPLPSNPKRGDVTNPLALRLFDLFNYSNVTLLYMLTGLYGHHQPEAQEAYPHLSAALQETVFAPAMTMLIRSLGEVLVKVPAADGGAERAGPNFFLDRDDHEMLADPGNARFTDIGFYIERFEEIDRRLGEILGETGPSRAPEDVAGPLRYIQQNVYRMTGNLRRIYQSGVYVKFRTTP